MAGMTTLFDPLPLKSGATLKNRFMLAPLTNLQSSADGVLSDDEYNWLVARAEGGFGLVMTCAASVHPRGLGFPGQLGAHDDKHLPGLTRLASGIKAHGAHVVVQIHHSGMRSPANIIGAEPLCPSDNEEFKARAMTPDEVREAIAAFVAAAQRAELAGFDGAELHGAHGYLICQFLSAEVNRRDDEYGGTLENRARFLMECIDGVRAACKPGFSLGVRLSPERFGMRLGEVRELAQTLMNGAKLDYIDMSLWDVFKEPVEDDFKGKPLIAHFTDLKRGDTRLGVAGKIMSGEGAARALDEGADFAVIGRGAILHHDFPRQVAGNAAFTTTPLPVSADYLRNEKLGEPFVNYMRTWKGFVAEEVA
jgi:2,4-dienoyl-CoA reductase-like NADH-dependent reductase (Old Yellow Enzyme family)